MLNVRSLHILPSYTLVLCTNLIVWVNIELITLVINAFPAVMSTGVFVDQLTHCGPGTPYGVIQLSQHWIR